MKKRLLFYILCGGVFYSFAQTYPVHDVDDCKLLYTVSTTNASYTTSTTNPDGGDASANVSSLLASANNGNAQFILPYSISSGTSIDWSARFYSDNAGSNNSGSGRFIIRLINRTIGGGAGDRVDLGTFNKDGGSWQTESNTGVSLSPTNAAAIDAAGGFNTILIIASSNASSIETLYFDNIELSVNYNLSDDTANLDSGNAWIYNNRGGDNNILPNFQSAGLTLDENITTPTITGNSASTVTRITRGTGAASLIQFNHTAIDPSVTSGSIKMRVYVTCQSPYVPKIRINLRDDGDVASQYTSSVDNPLVPGIWNELDFDLSAMTSGAPGGAVYNQTLILFDPGEASAADGIVYYLDALQIPAFSSTFDGDTDATWNTATNWSEDVLPNGIHNVTIPASQNVTIASTTEANANDITIDASGSLTISSGGSLIIKGSATGNITYNRTLGTTNWYLISSPVSGQDIDAFASAEGLAVGTDDNRGFAPYDNNGSAWVYYQAGASGTGNFATAKGYSVKLAATGDIAFTGTMLTADQTISITDGSANEFNLVGNPFPSYIAANDNADATNNILKVNDTDNDFLSESTLWFWDQSTNMYDQINQASAAFYIAPAQGFFVNANTTGAPHNLSITEAMQSHQGTDSFQRNTSRTEVQLVMTDGKSTRDADIYYISGTTTGFDNGYDSSIFGGVANSFAVYTEAVANSQGRKLGIQSLPDSDLDNMIIPVGVNSDKGSVSFTLKATNLPSGYKVYLEDKQTGNFIRLDESGSKYDVSFNETTNGIGRFFLHTATSSLSNDDVLNPNNNISAYVSYKNNLKVVGIQSGTAQVRLFNILGKQVLERSFTGNGANDVTLPNLRQGMYIIQISSDQGTTSKKIVIE